MLDPSGHYRKLEVRDMADTNIAEDELLLYAGYPLAYDKIADNIIRLYPKPIASVTAGLKFYFQRTPSYFVATDTVKVPGVPPLLHRGFIIASVYDALLSGIGGANVSLIGNERQAEQLKMMAYFRNRNTDEIAVISPIQITSI